MKKQLHTTRAVATTAGLSLLGLLCLIIALVTKSTPTSQGSSAHAGLSAQSVHKKICALGDTGSGNHHQYRVGAAMAAHGCTDILLLGDNFYPDGVSSTHDPQWSTAFEGPYAPLIAAGATFHVALGNHDYRGSTEAQLNYALIHPYFRLPSPYYFTQINNLCLIAIDTNQMNQEQADWLADKLQNDDCTIKIIYGHHPIVSSGRHGAGDEELQKFLRPALANAHLYLAGHDHHYSDEGNVTTENGSTFRQLVIGTGGARLRPTVCRTEDCRSVVNDYGFLELHQAPTPNGLTWSFYDKELVVMSSGGIGQ